MIAKSIKDIIEIALSGGNNIHAEYSFSKLPPAQAKIIQGYIHVNLTGAKRIIDSSAIRHTIRKHGNVEQEARRGQIAVTAEDISKIPLIVKEPDSITYAGKNNLKQDVFLYSKKIGSVYIVAEAVRISGRGDKLVFQSMYKKK